MNNSLENDMIQQFQDICALEDRIVARNYLRRFNWNIEEAVQDYLIARDGTENSSAERLQNAINFAHQQDENESGSASSSVVNGPIETVRNRAIVNRRVGWFEWSWSLVTLPFRFVMVTLYDIWCFIYRTFFESNRAITNPTEDVDKFIASYEAKYGQVHPTFYRGSYSQVLIDAKKELKYLCIYLHCETHRLTDSFCINTLNNPEVINFLNTRTLFWACSVKHREGYRVSQAMHETTYPFVGIICVRENRMMLVARQEGYMAADDFLSFLNTVIADNEIYLNLAIQERLNQRQNQELREQQERAFQESLHHDREKERRKRAQEEEEQRQARQAADEERRQNELRQILLERRAEMKNLLNVTENRSPERNMRVSIRFPDGCRLEERFGEKEPLNSLFQFVMSQDSCPDNFSVFNTLPRQKLLSARLLKGREQELQPELSFETFFSAGLQGSAALIVQDDDS